MRSPLLAAPSEPGRSRRRDLTVRWLAYALVLAITVIDGLIPAGIVVGILLTIPVLLSSIGDEPADVFFVSACAVVGFIVAAVFGRGAISPAAVWIPNRVFVTIAVLASCPLALILQRRRLDAEAARTRAERARDVSQLLQSLMAHDLRAPLALAAQALQVAREALPGSSETPLLHDVEGRLERSLDTVDRVLEASRAALAAAPPTPLAGGVAEASRVAGALAGGNGAATSEEEAPAVNVATVVHELLTRFEDDARTQGKTLELRLPQRDPGWLRVDATVLPQVLSIVVENALRHANPGSVRVSVSATSRELRISVADAGPGYSRRRAQPGAATGAGLGLKLSRVLAAKAGGTLTLEKDEASGSEFVLRLPIRATPASAGRQYLPRFLARARGRD